jgi:hypothetical protein
LDGLGRDLEVGAPPAALYGRHPRSDLHRNKRSVTLNIKVAKRREILLRLDRLLCPCAWLYLIDPGAQQR